MSDAASDAWPAEVARLRALLGERAPRALALPGFREAAVLVLLVCNGEDAGARLELLFTERHAGLPTHAGQVSFPGGKRDPGDASAEDTALREAREELGLFAPVHVLGRLDDVPTPALFNITPVVAAVRGPLSLTPSAGEVSEVFYAGVRELVRLYRPGAEREFLGVRYTMHEYPYQRFRIWGATATMLHQLLTLWRPGDAAG